MGLFERGEFKLHSGGTSGWKIECDALTEEDIATLALIISEKYKFRRVKGVPKNPKTQGLDNGGRLAKALEPYAVPADEYAENVTDLLVVDDVLTTGRSMLEAYEPGTRGVVIFTRDPEILERPDLLWIKSVFTMWSNG